MQYILILLSILFLTIQNISSKKYSLEFKNVKYSENFFVFISALTAFVFFAILYVFDFSFNIETLWYSLAFSLCFFCAIKFEYLSIKKGSLALTSLFISFSLLIPTFYGVFFLNEKVSVEQIIGIVILLGALACINVYGDKIKFSPFWLLLVSIAFFGNGFCCVLQKVHQVSFPKLHITQFMFFGMFFVTIFAVINFLFAKPKNFDVRKGIKQPVVKGLFNAMTNVSVMMLSSISNASFYNPFISAGGLLATFICAIFMYKEKLSITQYVGYALSISSVVLLSIA